MTSATIIGAAGGIGASVTNELVRQELFDVLHLVDLRTNLLEADRIDLTESAVSSGVRPPQITVDDPHSARGLTETADLVICAATLGEKPGQSRSSFAAVNWELLQSLAPVIARTAGQDGVILLITNPIDVMAECLARHLPEFGRDRIFGYSLNDSTRLRVAIASELGVEPHRVHADALGMHGEQLVPVFSGVRVDGEAVTIEDAQRQRIVAWMDGWFARWHALDSGRSSTRATATGVATVVKAMREGSRMPVSVSTDAIDSLPNGGFISYPARFDGGRAVPDPTTALTDAEQALLVGAAESVRASADALRPQ